MGGTYAFFSPRSAGIAVSRLGAVSRLRSDYGMNIHRKTFHSGHLYLDIDDCEVDTLLPSVFETLMAQEGKPLQVGVSSDRSRLVALLRQSGFELKRRCYEMDVTASDLAVSLPHGRLRFMRGKDVPALPGYAAVNPLTCPQEAFYGVLPKTAVYAGCERAIVSAAFIEENEIAYVCSSNARGFMEFAASLVSGLFERYGRIVFEADDTDWAAMQLKSLFVHRDGVSFDTYVKRIAHG